MQQVVIENPAINSPFEEPARHFRFDDAGITNEIVRLRRPSSYFVPIPQPRKTGGKGQQRLDDWRSDRIEENGVVNRIRQRVQAWRGGRYIYTVQRHYEPDFIVRLNDGHGPGDPLNLIAEATGDRDREKAAEVSTAKTLWVPAVNNAGQWGRWAFLEVEDPWNVKDLLATAIGA